MEDVDRLLKGTVEELERLLSAKNVLGEPIERDGMTVIPIVSYGFGFGAGGGEGGKAGSTAGKSSGKAAKDKSAKRAKAKGAGGRWAASGTPRASRSGWRWSGSRYPGTAVLAIW